MFDFNAYAAMAHSVSMEAAHILAGRYDVNEKKLCNKLCDGFFDAVDLTNRDDSRTPCHAFAEAIINTVIELERKGK